MPRSVRYIIPKLPHHAIQRGNNHQNIFFDREDHFHFMHNIKRLSMEEGVLIGAYCLAGLRKRGRPSTNGNNGE